MRSPPLSWQIPLIGAITMGALACSSTSHGSSMSGDTGASGNSGSAVSTGSTGGTTTGLGFSTGGSGASGSGGTGTNSGTAGGTTGGGGAPCLPDGGSACQPDGGFPPGCWFNAQTSDQIMNGCTLARYDQSIPPPPPDGGESLPLYDGGDFPLPPP